MKGVGGCSDRYFDHEKSVFILCVTFVDWPVNGLNSEMKHSPFNEPCSLPVTSTKAEEKFCAHSIIRAKLVGPYLSKV